MGVRYYDSSFGRWITRDQLAGLPDNPSSYHKYLYVDNNPLGAVDPSGYKKKVVSPALPKKKQEGTYWCWAASAQMVIMQQTDHNPSQTEIVEYVYGTAVDTVATMGQVQSVLYNWDVKSSLYPAMTWPGVKKEINRNDPILTRVAWQEQNDEGDWVDIYPPEGHAEVIYGYDTGTKGNKKVVIFVDPKEGKAYRQSYKNFATNYRGKHGRWSHSLANMH